MPIQTNAQRLSRNEKVTAGKPFSAAARCGSLMLTLVLTATAASAADWPCWGGQPSRNMASETEKGLPDWYSFGQKNDAGAIDPSTTKNIKWAAKVGSMTMGSPVVSQGKVFIGTTGNSTADSVLRCYDEKTGQELGRLSCGLRRGDKFGVCSTPTIEGDRLYFVAPDPIVMCVDLTSWLNSPSSAGESDSARHILWQYDMAKSLHVMQDHVASCSVLVHGDFLYVCTGNGRYKTSEKPYYPLTPSLIVLNKHTGQLVARDDEQIGEQLWRGQWSSPSLATVNGKPQILFATGNGLCYGFEPADPAAKVIPDRWITTKLRGPIVYFIDVKGKNTAGLSPADYASKFNLPGSTLKAALPLEFRYSIELPVTTPVNSIPTASVPDVPILRKIWSFDCLSGGYRDAPFYTRAAKGDHTKHPTDIVATPVFYRKRVYIAIGGDPNHGAGSQGNLVCIDPTQTGDITHTGKVWSYDQIGVTMNAVSILDGLVFIIDQDNVVHCLDADTGQKYWTYKLASDRGRLNSSLLAVDGKLFAGKSILAVSKTLRVLSTQEGYTTDNCSQPCVANGVLYKVENKWLWAVCDKRDKKP